MMAIRGVNDDYLLSDEDCIKGEMDDKREVERITDELYKSYGSDTGYLFGIKPDQRFIVQTIIKFTLEYNKGEEQMKKFIIREDTIKKVREGLKGNKDVLHDFDTGLCTLSPYMPSHLDLGNEDCCGIFMAIAEDNRVTCNECKMTINDAIRKLRR